ncbi:hypothetical protein ACHAXR_011180 [Thalassiosira sp. AJA248-18]
MEPDEKSNAHWLYHRCATARIPMETPLTPLQLSIKVLKLMKSIDENVDEVDQLTLSRVLKKDAKAKTKDLSFVWDLSERATELRDDGELSEEALRAIAAASIENDGTAALNDIVDGIVGGGGVDASATTTSSLDRPQSAEEMQVVSASPNKDLNQERINFDELHCFQLRTRVLGLNMPTFKELWKYLQAAGWTYTLGKYHIPKQGRNGRMKYEYTEGMAKRIYKHFNLDNTYNKEDDEQQLDQSDGEESNDGDDGEGPEVFDSPNDLVDYLDEFCMPDYRATAADIQSQEMEFSAKSKAYKRRNKRLRFELLEIAYRERLRKSDLGHDDANTKSKYGHSHRPCEVCFKGSNHLYPRVACRECGLVVHTFCYGLLDHGEKEANNTSRSNNTVGNKKEVDEKGFFTCDVCAQSLSKGSANKTRWYAIQSSGWRLHDHPNAVCPLCERKDITGAMVRIVVGGDEGTGNGVSGKKNTRKRRSRRSVESSENWVHLFCINSLPSCSTAPSSIRSSDNAILHIRDALDRATEIVKETESMRETTLRCVTCATRKGDLVQCEGTCKRFFHRLCLQIDCLDVVEGNAKKEHLCLRCRGIESAPQQDDTIAEVDISVGASSKEKKMNARHRKSSKVNSRKDKNTEEIDQYFRNTGKNSSKSEAVKSDLIVPSQEDCIAEVESLHHHSNVDDAFGDFEVQYQQQFREWSFLMATNQSLLLYGLGSKSSVLTSFGHYLSAEGDVVSLNGYDPSIDLNQFLDYLDQLFCDESASKPSNGTNNISVRESNKGLAKKAASIAKKIASTRSQPLFVLIHNIDGVGLRNRFAQDAIGTLTANSRKDCSPLIRVVASVDNVNASMVLWSPQVEHKFDWAWKQVHTYRPYFEEVRSLPQSESSKKAKKGAGKRKHGTGAAAEALKVLACLAPRHTEVLQLLATLQANSSNSILYSILREECIKKMLTSSDTSLRTILKELFDHNIVASKKDDEGIEHLFVPSAIPIHEILSFKPMIPTK